MENIVDKVRRILIENIDEKTKNTGQNFFKERIEFYGVKVSKVTSISKDMFVLIENLPKTEILSICERLWQSGYNEEAYIACNWSYYINEYYEPDDFNIFERWLTTYVYNWGTCDTLCNHTIGTFIEMYPEYAGRLKTWALSDNRWVRRGAAVTLIIPARKGLFHNDIFEIADILLLDKDDLVQKGYGWMLKAASESDREKVFDFLMLRKDKMPRTALRYACEKFPPVMRAEVLKKDKF